MQTSKFITVKNILINVEYEVDSYQLEPFSTGISRGSDYDVYVTSVKVDGSDTNIIDLLSTDMIETIEEEIRRQ